MFKGKEILGEVRNIGDFLRTEITKLSTLANDVDALTASNRHLSTVIAAQNDVIADLKGQLAQRSENALLRSHNESMRKALDLIMAQKDKDDALLEGMKSYLKEQGGNLTDLAACFEAVLCGMFDHEHIEFVALKTYRGWKYIYHDGEVVDNVDDIESVTIKTGDRVDVNIVRKGKNVSEA